MNIPNMSTFINVTSNMHILNVCLCVYMYRHKQTNIYLLMTLHLRVMLLGFFLVLLDCMTLHEFLVDCVALGTPNIASFILISLRLLLVGNPQVSKVAMN